MNQTQTVLEQLSALADGQLGDEQFSEVLTQVDAEPALRARWQAYHLVGDVLRSGAHAPCSDSNLFLARLQQRLAAEPVALVPAPVSAVVTGTRMLEAANGPVFRWKLLAGVASVGAAAAIGWAWIGGSGGGAVQAGAQLAQQQGGANSVLAVAVSPAAPGAPSTLTPTRVLIGNGEAQVLLRDPRLDELLEAHQQVSGASQMPSGFLRNATFEAPAR